MERGKIICIEGTDCSGKGTQTKRLLERLSLEGQKVEMMSFPVYDSPTGKIIGGPYLGKENICSGWFSEGANQVDPKVASLYYAADRLYHLSKINAILDSGTNLILDRYVSSNMGHQGGKIKNPQERKEMYEFLEKLEYDLLGLPSPDLTIFLFMPYEIGQELKKGREDATDQHENNLDHMLNAEKAYLELAKQYNWVQINCAAARTLESIKSIEQIHEEVYHVIKDKLNI